MWIRVDPNTNRRQLAEGRRLSLRAAADRRRRGLGGDPLLRAFCLAPAGIVADEASRRACP